MIHEWFMHFGLIAIIVAFLPFLVIRKFTNRHPSKDKQGSAVGAIFVGVVGAIFLAIALVSVLLGFSGTITGWIGIGVLSIAAGIGNAATND